MQRFFWTRTSKPLHSGPESRSPVPKLYKYGNHDVQEWSIHDVTRAYGYPHVRGYDGVHLFGRAGKYILTRSILSIMNEAKIIQVQPLPAFSAPPHPTYDPMLVLRDRIKSVRSAPNPSYPSPTAPHASSAASHPSSCIHPPPARTSVIRPVKSVIQNLYSIPVSNTFDVLGN